ncbi:MAG: carbamoyltransferase HypF [Gemmataceae bacterium]|nr:carbamoyltransferase HypF [Gemmata sp.]MDW8196755.1 carbamoyltransferase HypF [Gemmataceae bacterium]
MRKRLVLRGVVQGVGFRPFVYRLAQRHQLRGFVSNNTESVVIEVQGVPEAIAAFEADLINERPPLARIEAVTSELCPLGPDNDFRIVASSSAATAACSIPADIATCADCLRELFDPADRRYRYPFINCTNCGPRFTIIRELPYDRPATTMAAFALCPACAREYHDPANRRFHAQPIACPVCGPHVWLEMNQQTIADKDAAIQQTLELLNAGRIVAVKGIGGFHLACDATNSHAVQTLRERKGRGWKPLAVMVRDLAQARAYAHVSPEEAAILTGPERPIVLLSRRTEGSHLAEGVAPGQAYLGLMLPYSPLHHLLVKDRPLVMTSGNRSDEPIARDNAEARQRLAHLADAFLFHNRDIHTVCDDSVVRVVAGHEYPLRRSRGFTPLPVPLPRPVRPVLAVGGELKATLCLTTDTRAILSQHLGDVESIETLTVLDRTAEQLLALVGTEPEAIVCDAHPGYLSAEWAQRYAARRGRPLRRVQHHRAHVASLLTDVAWRDGPVVVVCFDGTGYGDDGAIWGGELFLAQDGVIRRVAKLSDVPLPGGDAAIRRPYRAALAHLWAAGVPWSDDWPCVAACPPVERRILWQQLQRQVGCVPTSSAGRLFDAVAAILGIRQTVSYEAQAAMEMESLAAVTERPVYPIESIEGEVIVWNLRPLIQALVADVQQRVPVALIAGRFHATVAEAIARLAQQLRRKHTFVAVGLTGGVFQNVRLLEQAVEALRASGWPVLTHRHVPTNDGGLSLGQAVLATELYRDATTAS